jgi:hypothetical protein
MGGIHGGRNIEKVHGDGMGHHGSELRIHSCDQIDGLGSQVAEEVKARKVLYMGCTKSVYISGTSATETPTVI